MLILLLRAPIVDEPGPLPKMRQPECTTHDTRHQLGEGLVIKGLRPIRQSSSTTTSSASAGLLVVQLEDGTSKAIPLTSGQWGFAGLLLLLLALLLRIETSGISRLTRSRHVAL